MSRVARAISQGRRSPKRPGPYLIAANDLGIYCLPVKAAQRPACRAVLRGEVYEPETIRYLCDNAQGDIVHAGTFFGDFLPALSRAYEHVWAFEPNGDSYKCAEITVRLNDLANVTVRNSALGDRARNVTLCTEKDGVYLGGASFVVDQEGETLVETVDSIVPSDRHVGAIHFDVERFEHAALEGARETIRRCSPLIVLETVPPVIAELGYEETRLVERNHVFRAVS